MLQLKQITKQYLIGEKVIDALRGVTVDFKDREFTAVLGMSGCGKTTLMNIVGGLDTATSGNLIIDGVSTNSYKDKDWNNYRNHQIGFVFQSYNLIPHMTVFSNVELALTLSGVNAKERKKRVLDALTRVGLSDQAFKKPNQMSGGQMQRVAIARAIVNSPKILLADEPTGAVDSSTGVQIMEILKEISKDCLVIMVTHNQELADHYADRIIRMQDGLILSDHRTNAAEECVKPTKTIFKNKYLFRNNRRRINKDLEEKPKEEKKKRAKMSFATAIKLSYNNLINKKGRSIMTVISGAISVICIALILAMNSGFAYYINDFERNNLSRFPIKVTTQSTSLIDLINEAFEQRRNFDVSNVNINSMLEMFKEDKELREKYSDAELIYLSKLILAIIEKGLSGFENMGIDFNEDYDDNDFDVDAFGILSEIFGVSLGTDIVEFIRALDKDFNPEWGAVMRNYDIEFDIYRKNDKNGEARLNPVDMIIAYLENSGILSFLKFLPGNVAGDVNAFLYGNEASRLRTMFDNNNPWSMMLDDATLINAQYEVLAGRLPAFGTDAAKNEIVLVVDEYNQLDDFTLFLLGVISVESFMLSIINQIRPYIPESVASSLDLFINILIPKGTEEIRTEYNFREFIGNGETMPATFVLRVPTDYYGFNEKTGAYDQLDTGEEVEVVGILRLREGLTGGVIHGAIGYTEALAKALIDKGNNAPVVQALNSALDEYNMSKEVLLNLATRLMNVDFDMEALSQLTIPERITVLSEIMSRAGDINISEEQIASLTDIIQRFTELNIDMESLANFTMPERIAVILEIAMLASSINLTPEQIILLTEIAELLGGFELTEQNQAALTELLSLVETLNISGENSARLSEIIILLGGLSSNEDNIAVLGRAIALLSQLESIENNIDILAQAAALLGGVDFNEESPEAILAQITAVLGGMELSDGDVDVLLQVAEELAGLNLSEEDAAVLRQVAEIIGQMELSEENLQAMLRMVELMGELEISYEDIALLRQVMDKVSQLNVREEDTAALLEIISLIGELNLTPEDVAAVGEIVTSIGQINLSEEEQAALLEILALLPGFDINDTDTLYDIVSLIYQIDLTEEEQTAVWRVLELGMFLLGFESSEIDGILAIAHFIIDLNFTKEDVISIIEIVSLIQQIDLTEEEQAALSELIALLPTLDINNIGALGEMLVLLNKIDLTEDEQAAVWRIIELGMSISILGFESDGVDNILGLLHAVADLNLTPEDFAAVEEIMALIGQIELSEEEQAALSELLSLVSSGFDMTDFAVLGDIVALVYQIDLTEEEQAAVWRILELGMFLLGFSNDDISNVSGLLHGVIDLNLTVDEINLIVEILPMLGEMDLSGDEAELLSQISQLGDIFQIRNVTVAENSQSAWFDSVQFKTLMDSFELKDLLRPLSVDIYPYSIESRNEILKFITDYNLSVQRNAEISPTTIDYSVIYIDELSNMTASMSSMINTITYILIGVAAVAVIVAMLLVAIILYISVQDRIKEIGLLRSLGASKTDVSSVFIAETFIIGLVSGIVGVGFALALTWPANIIMKSILGISGLLRPVWWHQFTLIGVAFVITVISGLIPAVMAARKDPVLALRSE